MLFFGYNVYLQYTWQCTYELVHLVIFSFLKVANSRIPHAA